MPIVGIRRLRDEVGVARYDRSASTISAQSSTLSAGNDGDEAAELEAIESLLDRRARAIGFLGNPLQAGKARAGLEALKPEQSRQDVNASLGKGPAMLASLAMVSIIGPRRVQQSRCLVTVQRRQPSRMTVDPSFPTTALPWLSCSVCFGIAAPRSCAWPSIWAEHPSSQFQRRSHPLAADRV